MQPKKPTAPGDQIEENLIGGLKAAKKGAKASNEFYDRMVANRTEKDSDDDMPLIIRE